MNINKLLISRMHEISDGKRISKQFYDVRLICMGIILCIVFFILMILVILIPELVPYRDFTLGLSGTLFGLSISVVFNETITRPRDLKEKEEILRNEELIHEEIKADIINVKNQNAELNENFDISLGITKQRIRESLYLGSIWYSIAKDHDLEKLKLHCPGYRNIYKNISDRLGITKQFEESLTILFETKDFKEYLEKMTNILDPIILAINAEWGANVSDAFKLGIVLRTYHLFGVPKISDPGVIKGVADENAIHLFKRTGTDPEIIEAFCRYVIKNMEVVEVRRKEVFFGCLIDYLAEERTPACQRALKSLFLSACNYEPSQFDDEYQKIKAEYHSW